MSSWFRKVAMAIGAALMGLSITACATSGDDGKAIAASDPMSVPDSTSMVQGADFRIAPLDQLEVRVFGVQTISGSYQVDPNGQLDMPLLGAVDAKGYTTFEFARLLEQKLEATYLQNPQVSVRITESYGQQVTVDGAVTKPGIYQLRGSTTLLQVVAVAGGPTDTADLSKVVIFRTIEGKRRGAAFDLTKIRTGQADDPVVFGNDIVVIDGSGAAQGYREAIRAIPVLGAFFLLF